MSASELLYTIREAGFILWLDDEILNYRQVKNCKNSDTVIELLKDNKSELIELLRFNDCVTPSNFEKLIFKTLHNTTLSFAQERLWFIDQYENGSNAYNIPMIFKLEPETNIQLLKQSITCIVLRHEVLRSLIQTDSSGVPYQTTLTENDFYLEIKDMVLNSRLDLTCAIEESIQHVYALDKEIPIRVSLYNLGNDKYMGIIIHHIAFDGWSIDVFLKELLVHYEYYINLNQKIHNMPNPLIMHDALPIQYKDFAMWQRRYLMGDVLSKQLNYWKDKLNGYELLNLPLDYSRPLVIDYKGCDVSFELDSETSAKLNTLAKSLGVSLYSLLLAGYYLLISCYSNQDDIVVGTPVANRHYEQLDGLIGFFVNTLALRKIIDRENSIKEFIKAINNDVIEAQINQDMPFEKLVAELDTNKDMSRHPIFQTVFGLQNFGGDVFNSLKNNPLEWYTDYRYNVAKFDLTLMMQDSGKSLKGTLNYATSLFKKETIENYIITYKYILNQLSDRDLVNNLKIKNISYVTSEKINALLYKSRLPQKINFNSVSIFDLFEKQVKYTPNNIAVICDDRQLTYWELNEQSNKLSHYLMSNCKLSLDEPIVLYMSRSDEIVIAMLAILKVGCAYVPIDPCSPVDRVNYILEDTNAKIIITNKDLLNDAIFFKMQYLSIVLNSPEIIKSLDALPTTNIAAPVTGLNLAYIMYTSGTTGKPKGVMIDHQCVTSLVKDIDYIKITPTDCIMQLADIAFDAATFEIWGALLNGAALFMPVHPKEILSNQELLTDIISNQKISILWLTKTAFDLIYLQNETIFNSLNYLLIGGEALNYELVKKLIDSNTGPKHVINGYGPTENTTFSCTLDISSESLNNGKTVPIGKPFNNRLAYVLDPALRILPVGAIGELYVGGYGLARGYLNGLDLTNEKFISNIFQTEEEQKLGINTKLYKTGDIVRSLPDGNLIYLGRNDFQVKIRGYRIELGEIEFALNGYPGIKQATVLIIEGENSNKVIVGYYVADAKLSENVVLKYLTGILPEYMIPNTLVYLSNLPITGNGKLDTGKLPLPEFTSALSYVKPRNELEVQICNIYATILGIDAEKIGVTDDFFRLGGNSILAIKLANKLSRKLSLSISVANIFQSGSIRVLMENHLNNPEATTISKVLVENESQQFLSFAQERLWFIDQYEGGSNAYNIPLIFKLAESTDINMLMDSIRSIVSRHKILRSIIKINQDGVRYQVVLTDNLNIPILHTTNQDELDGEINKAINYVFNLSEEFPIKVQIYREGISNYLSVVVHHIAFDGWSADIFLKELHSYYTYFMHGKSDTLNSQLKVLPELTIQYKDFALWQREYLTGEVLSNQLSYWVNKLKDYEILNLPLDKARPKELDYIGDDIYFEIDENTSTNLRIVAKQLNTSLYTVLLSGYYLLLSCYSHQKNIVVGTPLANRHFPLVDGIIGLFVNSLALNIKIDEELSIVEFIKLVGEEVINVQLHQDIPFEKLVEELKIEKDSSRHPIFQVMFGVQNFGSLNQTNLFEQYNGGGQYKIAKFDLSTFIDDNGDKLIGSFNYRINLFNNDTIKGYITTYKEILNQLTKILNVKNLQLGFYVKDIRYLSKEFQHKLLVDGVGINKPYPQNKTIHRLFEEQVKHTPDNIAFVYEDKRITYQELNMHANQLAHNLIDNYQINPDDLIALCLSRNEHILIAILATLKAGAAYVPIDPSYPEDRVKYILTDTKAKVFITNKNLMNSISVDAKLKVEIDDEAFSDTISNYPITNPVTTTASCNLAYVIYTSGTTGNPKGVMIEHRSVVNLAIMQGNEFFGNGLGYNNCLWYANYVFDAHVSEVYTVLLRGLSLYLVNDEIRKDVEALSLYIKDNHIDIATIPPALLNLNNILPLKTIVVAGEKTSGEILSNYYQHGIRIINAYGPTESTVCATFNHFTNNGASNVGRPITNILRYVLDDQLRLIPIGAIGELYISGAGLARGYLNQPGLTSEKFINNPYQENSRLYKTGDLVRLLPDGNLDYIGRNDQQVKIRGFRIELSEIETILNNYSGIKQSVILALERENSYQFSNKYLVGYYVADNQMDNQDILDYLGIYLPEYMIPNVLIHLSKLPMTINGKLDSHALPHPEFVHKDIYVAPKNELEIKLVGIWSKILTIPSSQIGINDNFFSIGGNSILIMQLKYCLERDLSIPKIKIVDLFKYTTINQFIDFIQINKNEPKVPLSPMIAVDHESEIAIISMSGAFSGCDDIEQYWQMILAGEEGVMSLDLSGNKNECHELLMNNSNYVPKSGVIPNIDTFDSKFWGVSPNEATIMDPQLRKLLEHCWSALEKSGYSQNRDNISIGVFVGGANSDYLDNCIIPNINSSSNMWDISLSNDREFFATKVSFLLGITGPSLNINTACSTSLVAIAEACDKLKLGRCNMAIAGGVSIPITTHHGYIYHEGMIMSKDGVCRPFDINANGTIPGAGVGVVVLKTLKQAIMDNDNIVAVIKGYAVNNDGKRKISFTAPSIIGQTECIIQAHQAANVKSDSIDYIECHGTGTVLGDPIEVEALQQSFSLNTDGSRSQKCFLGSVKANIGHADTAAGIAGLIKVCHMLKHKVIPQQINHTKANPYLHLEDTPFNITTVPIKWTTTNRPRIASVSSFGVGGTNAHLVIAENDKFAPKQVNKNINDKFLLIISAKTKIAMKQYEQKLADYLTQSLGSINLAQIEYTLQQRREHFSHRSFITGKTEQEIIDKLQLNQISYFNIRDTNIVPKIVFMFPGQGSQYINMAHELYVVEPLFKQVLDECFKIIWSQFAIDFKEILFPKTIDIKDHKFANIINQTKWSQLGLFVISYSLAKFIASKQILAENYIGHSIGEFVAATLTNVFTLEVAIKIIVKRGELMQGMNPGKMLAIAANFEDIKQYIPPELDLAAVNAPGYIVVAGKSDMIDNLKLKLDSNHISTSILHTSHAFHSRMMKNASLKFEEFLRSVEINHPTKFFISSVTGDFIKLKDAISPEYWATQIMRPVQFSSGIKAIIKAFPHVLFLEIGPGNTLSTFVSKHNNIDNISPQTISSLPSAREHMNGELFCIKNLLGKLWLHGFKLIGDVSENHTPDVMLPTYQFEKVKLWIQSTKNNTLAGETIDDKNMLEVYSKSVLIENDIQESEQTIGDFFSDILGMVEFSKFDSFFDLGGNSLLAIRLINKLNTCFSTSLKVADIFANSTVQAIAALLLSDHKIYQAIVKLNKAHNLPNLFMIHPGSGGCEVYSDLANKLFDNFCCYGVDSYNIYNDKKILSLNELANYYLQQISGTLLDSNQVQYNLFGWSLGGHIALEIATILEKNPNNIVNVYLLDTIISDDYIRALLDLVNTETIKLEYINNSINMGYDESYIKRVTDNIEIESVFVKQPISGKLHNTNITLFKALEKDTQYGDLDFQKIHNYVVSNLKYNNIDKYSDYNNIRLIKVPAHHGNILDQEDMIISVLLKDYEIYNSRPINTKCVLPKWSQNA